MTQISDVLQYVFGELFGKTSIAPAISPSKTIEGLAGGGVGAIFCETYKWRKGNLALGRPEFRVRVRSMGKFSR